MTWIPKNAASQPPAWYEKPLRISALQCNFENGRNLEVIDKWVDMGFNVEQLFHPMADDYSALYDRAKHEAVLKEYLAQAKKNNLRVILYLNVHILGPSLQHQQNTWAQRDRENKITLLYDTYPAVCINSPWRNHFFEVLADVARLEIDGIFLDGPIVTATGCHCPFCQRQHQEWFGKPLPAGTPAFEFNQRTRDDFLEQAYRHWKNLRPEAIFYINLPAAHATPAFVDIEKALTYNDLVGTEGGFMFYQPPKNVFLFRPGFTAKLLEAIAPDKPRVIFMAGDQKPWSWYLHSPAETQLCVASCVGNGANVWWGIHGSTQLLPTRSGQASREMFRFLAQNEKFFENTTSGSKVGLLYSFTGERMAHGSYDASDFTGDARKAAAPKGDPMQSLNGYYNMLVRSQIPFDILTDFATSAKKYHDYDCIILPATGALSAPAIHALREYVAGGGHLIAEFDCTLFDADGRPRTDFALADVFGVHFGGKYFELANHNYFVAQPPEHPFFQNLEIPLFPAPLLGVKVEPAASARVLARYLAPLPGRYVPLTQPENPFLISHAFGKGEVLFFTGAFGMMYHEYAPAEYRKIVANAVNHLARPVLRIKNGAAGALEISVRRQLNRTLLHLVNYNGDMTRPIERIAPLENLEIEFFPTQAIQSVTNAVSGQKIQFNNHEKSISFTIRKIEIYALIVLE
jgi:hypothetical protein